MPAPVTADLRLPGLAGQAETDEDDGEPTSPGGMAPPGLASCIKVSGTVIFGLQRDQVRAGTTAKASGLAPSSVTSFPLTATFRIENGQELENGAAVLAAFEFQTSTSASGEQDTTPSEASISIGAWQFGYAGSRFDFWSGEDFIFVAKIPSRSVNLVAFEAALSDRGTVSFSIEDTPSGQPGTVAVNGRRVPDGVVRLQYQSDTLLLHAAVAARDVPGAVGRAARIGRAGIVGVDWKPTLFGQEIRLSGQVAAAVDAAPYIGSQLDRRTALPLLLPDDPTRGWSAVASIGWNWSDSWASNAYVGRYRLSLPGQGAQGVSIGIDRVAGNIVWKPLEGFRAGLELSVAKQRTGIVGRAQAVGLSGQQASVQAFIERAF